MQRTPDGVKWKLWHGKPDDALSSLNYLWILAYAFRNAYPGHEKFEAQLEEFMTYIRRNAAMITNYGRDRRAGLAISTSFVESMVNALLARRFVKKQQMQWTPRGAHRLLQVRVKVANDELRDAFRRWYPGIDGFGARGDEEGAMAA